MEGIQGEAKTGGKCLSPSTRETPRHAMTRKPQKKRPDSDPLQYERFLEAARVAEASDDPNELTKAVRTLNPLKPKPIPQDGS
jgi:hypothetical protein